MNNERWRTIPGWSGYLISSLGRVYNDGSPYSRAGSPEDWENGKCHRGTSPHLVSPKKRFMAIFDHRGSPHTMLHKAGKSYNIPVIDLMASAFFGPTPPEYEVAVKNGDKYDTRLENLYFKQYELPGTKAERTKKKLRAVARYEKAKDIQTDKPYLRVKELQQFLDVSRDVIETAVKRGALRVERIGSMQYRIPVAEVLLWLRREAGDYADKLE